MRRIVWCEYISLDGVVEEPGKGSIPYIPEEVAGLKRRPGENILIGASSALARSLLQHELIVEIRMLVHPITVGKGKRMLEGANESIRLKLVGARAFDSGAVALTYRGGA